MHIYMYTHTYTPAAVAAAVPVRMATVTIFSSTVVRMVNGDVPAMCGAGRIIGQRQTC